MSVLTGLVLAYAACAAACSVCVAFVAIFPGRWSAVRAFLAALAGARPLGADGVVLQEGPFGCGRAALATLHRRLGDPERAAMVVRRVPALMPVSMREMADLLGEAGLKASGYEFQASGQFRDFVQRRPKDHVLLLLKDYAGAAPLPALLLLPLRLLLGHFGGSSRPVLHWTLLEDLGHSRVTLLDPFLGRVSWNGRRFTRAWAGYALFVTPAGERERGEECTCSS